MKTLRIAFGVALLTFTLFLFSWAVKMYQIVHAQKPEPVIVTGDPCGLSDKDGKYTKRQVQCLLQVGDQGEVGAWLEFHCVAVLDMKREGERTIVGPIARLKCSEEKAK